MMGEQVGRQDRLFYAFCLEDRVPVDNLLRRIDAVLDLSWLRSALKPCYSHTGSPSVDPEPLIRMLLVGYCYSIRSERRLCQEVEMNLAYRWFCRLGLEDTVPDHSTFSVTRRGRFRQGEAFRQVFEHVLRDCRDIDPHIPIKDMSRRSDGTLSRADFTFDAERDVYICPQRKTLRTTGRVFAGNALYYRASKFDCERCPLKPGCCPKAPVRRIPRDVNEAARDHARALMGTEPFLQSGRERKKIETLFGDIKRNLGSHG